MQSHNVKVWLFISHPCFCVLYESFEGIHDMVFILFGQFLYRYNFIYLYQIDTDKDEIYVICGDQYKLIAESFSEFIELYNNAIELQMG